MKAINDCTSIKEVVREYLVYQDVMGLSKEGLEDRVMETLKSFPNSGAYAQGLKDLERTHGVEKVANAASRMKTECHKILAKLSLAVSDFGRSCSWAYWDLGKQYHYFCHPEGADRNYTIADPLVSPEKFQEIIDRHVGWEIYARRNSAIPSLNTLANWLEISKFLEKSPNQFNSLPSHELASLGKLVRTELAR